MKDGLLLVDKQPGCTSHDVVQRVRRLLRQKKTGHCGTLDPDATGLLVLTLGKATRLTRFLIRAPKVYEGVIRFGVATDTYDAAGTVTAEAPTAGLTLAAIAAAMERFVGPYEQKAPAYSAKKVKGMKLYELARRGEEVPEESKEVTIFELAPIGELADDRLAFRLACSSGTYARSLAHELGRELGVGAHLAALRRLQVGPFQVASAVTLEKLAATLEGRAQPAESTEPNEPAEPAEPGDWWVPFDSIPLPFAEITTDSQQEARIQNGQTVLVRELAGEEGDWIKLVNRRRQFIAVGTVVERIGNAGVGVVQPRVVFH